MGLLESGGGTDPVIPCRPEDREFVTFLAD